MASRCPHRRSPDCTARARAHALLGDGAGFAEAAAHAHHYQEGLPATNTGLFAADAVRISYDASSHIWLDHPQQARTAALEAIHHYQAAHAPTRLSIAQLDLALACTALAARASPTARGVSMRAAYASADVVMDEPGDVVVVDLRVRLKDDLPGRRTAQSSSGPAPPSPREPLMSSARADAAAARRDKSEADIRAELAERRVQAARDEQEAAEREQRRVRQDADRRVEAAKEDARDVWAQVAEREGGQTKYERKG
ncbi:hypothetical protein ACIBIZ_48165 [Nonomuraea spiralis]|uniref:hypothetical protein n=1 Tax=Nonomuraea spiralis TaxID=46182 RepID=UPI0037B0F333